MKSLAILSGLALAFFLAAGLAQAQPGALPVMVSVPPQKYVVEKLAGPLAAVEVMVPKGADAHSFEPKPSQMAKAAKAKLYFAQGVEFEQVWLPKIAKTNPSLKVVDTVAGIERMPMEEHHEHEGEERGHGKKQHAGGKKGHDHDDLELDPHVWASPALLKVMAAHMAKGLAQADPANAAAYEANLKTFDASMDALDKDIRLTLSGIPAGSEFIVFHPAWAYFAKDYGLKEVSIQYEGREPGPKKLAELIEHAKESKAKVIFVQPQFSKKSAETLAKAIGARLVVADPLDEDLTGNLKNVAASLAEALKK